MKPSSWDKQLGLASPRGSAASQSDQTNNPSKNEVRNEVGLDVSHHARISQRGGEKFFSLTSSFIGWGQPHSRHFRRAKSSSAATRNALHQLPGKIPRTKERQSAEPKP